MIKGQLTSSGVEVRQVVVARGTWDAQQHKTASVTRALSITATGLDTGSTGEREGLVPRVIMPLYLDAEDHRSRGVTWDWRTVYPSPPRFRIKKPPRASNVVVVVVVMVVE